MDLQIRYCTTEDGAHIAYSATGAGEMIIVSPSFQSFAHVMPDLHKQLIETLSQSFTVVQFDGRGMGMSDRKNTDYSLEARVEDLRAVAAAMRAERFSLLARLYAVPVCIAFAARFPERVVRLMLLGGYADGARFYRDSEFGRVADALRDLTVQQWEFVSRTMIARGATDDTPTDIIEQRAAFMRDAWTPEALLAFREANQAMDVTADLPHVAAPTMIVHAFHSLPEVSAEFASTIPDARVLKAKIRWDGFDDDGLRQVVGFFGGTVSGAPATAHRDPSGVRTILFTDIVGHTEMMQRLGDAKGRDVLREHERITRDLLKRHAGAEVKTMGDGFMASFASVASAVDCAIALQRAFDASSPPNAGLPEPVAIRVGLNAGEPIEEDGDLFGSTVILASRIASKAGAGEILVPDTVRSLLSGKNFLFSDRGEFVPKGFDDAVRLYEVRWRQ